ncbi:DUF2018 family protein [Helicobacter sp. 23-1044]
MQKNNDIFDEIFESSPLEHLIKILPQLSPSALQTALEAIFAEYAIMERVIENENLGEKVRELNQMRDSAIDSRKQDLALRLMHEVLSQGD